MPLYDFKCSKCGKEFEYVCKIADRASVKCQCGGATEQIVTKFPNQDWFKSFISEDFNGEPIEVRTKNHLRQLCREHGVYSRALGHGFNLSEV